MPVGQATLFIALIFFFFLDKNRFLKSWFLVLNNNRITILAAKLVFNIKTPFIGTIGRKKVCDQ